ncbi:MAG: sugar ABC transporter permease [Rhodospirillales bacterium]|nr:sugar ABC transporter permease [Rhodospirillales bacterium]
MSSHIDRPAATRGGVLGWLQIHLPKIVLSPTLAITGVFVYGFIIWTTYLSFTKSRMFPVTKWEGISPHVKLWANPVWEKALENLAIFGILYIGIATVVGLILAVMLDQRIRQEGVIRTIYLYPMALSFIVTGTVWKWMLNPGLGLEKLMHDFGWASFKFDWIVNSDMAIYTVVIAGVWQSSGFVMAMFLAGLRAVDDEIIKAASIDGASQPIIYWKVIFPLMRPIFLSSFVVLSHLAIKSYDLVIALTGGGPGYSTALPATFMYSQTFTRNHIDIGSASAVMMLITVAAIMVPYLYSELKAQKGVRQ